MIYQGFAPAKVISDRNSSKMAAISSWALTSAVESGRIRTNTLMFISSTFFFIAVFCGADAIIAFCGADAIMGAHSDRDLIGNN